MVLYRAWPVVADQEEEEVVVAEVSPASGWALDCRAD